MSKRFIITIITILVLVVATGIAILLTQGYTFSPQQKSLVGTGIITITSEPDAASVYIDGHLTTATNATVSSLSPKTYSVRVIKEGFIPWEKQVNVKEGLVTALKVTLFPAIPTIYPLTFNGVVSPVLSLDGSKLAFVVPASTTNTSSSASKKAGIWVWTQTQNQPISFARSAEPHQIAQNTIADFSKATLKWSSDSKQVLATVGNNNYLLDVDKLNSEPRDITPTLKATLKSWEDDTKLKAVSSIETIKDVKLRQIASESGFLRFSPDETKFMARKEPILEADLGKVVSDLKVYSLEDKPSLRSGDLEKEYSLPPAKAHVWLSDSRHVILVEDKSISIVDFDGTNKAVIYAGSFYDSFVFPWLDSSRLVIISSIPTPTASEPNLFGINLK